MVVLGDGACRVTTACSNDLADAHPGKLRAFLEFSSTLAHQIEAGADIFLMPSLYEPCGLNQLYSLVHGTVPVVRATGGLADTVVDATAGEPGRRHGHRIRLPGADPRGPPGGDRPGAGPLAATRRSGRPSCRTGCGATGHGTTAPGSMSGSTTRSRAAIEARRLAEMAGGWASRKADRGDLMADRGSVHGTSSRLRRPARHPSFDLRERMSDVDGRPGPDVAPAPAVLPRRRRRREPDALGPPARRQGLLGMALHLEEVPEMRCTINLVPSLLVQLEAYVERGHRPPPRRLAAARRRPRPRRRHLPARPLLHGQRRHDDPAVPALSRAVPAARRWASSSAEQALRRFRERDLRDLQVWSNLAWIHPLAFEHDAELRRVPRQGPALHRGREGLAARQAPATCSAQIIPLHRKLAERGQVELTTTPFYHPILPLLLRQAAGPRGDARRRAAALPRRLPRGRRGPRPPRRRVPPRALRRAPRAACGRARAPSARR